MAPAVKEVNEKTDIRIVREDIKEGRSVTHIKMHITQDASKIQAAEQSKLPILLSSDSATAAQSENNPAPLKRKTKVRMKIESLPEPQRACALRLVDVYKLSVTKAIEFVKMDGGVLYCQAQMEYVRNAKMAGQVKNVGGYIRKALEEDYAGKKSIQEQAMLAEVADKADKALWDRQTNKITQDIADRAMRSHSADNDEHSVWEEKFDSLRKELMKLLLERKIDFAGMKKGIDAWKKVNPEPSAQ